MKIIKYILFFLCIFLISCMTNEITIENHIIEQNMNTYTCFFDIHSIEELKWIEQAAAKTGVQVFVRSESLVSAGKIEHTFYHVNADCFQSSYPLSNPYRSLTKGVITEKYRPLSELHSVHENLSFHVRKNVGNTQQFFDIVTKRIPMLTKNANPIFHSPFSNIMVLGWLLFYAFVLFLSFFYISCIRRENAIRMCFGFSLTRIVLCNILLDIVVYLVLIITQYFILSQYSTFALTNRYKYYYGIAILCGICPYLSLFQFNVKDISHRNYGWNRLFRSSYVLKIASVVTLLFSFSLFASVGLKAFSAYQTANMMQILHAYDILTLESNTESEKYKEYHKILGDDAFADHQCRNDGFNTFYLEHRKDVFLMSASHYDTYDIVFYNDNASSILFNVFKDELTGCSADVVMLCPEIEQSITLKEISNRKNEMLYTYSKFCGARYNVSIESVSYKKSIKIPYFTINDNNLIDFATNPYIIVCRKAPTGFNLIVNNLNMVDTIIAMPDNPSYIKDFESTHTYVFASVIDLDSSIQYLSEKSTRELLSIMLLVMIMLTLQYIMTQVLVSFYHKINMKEIAILRTTGAPFINRYGKHLLLQSIIYSIVGLIGVCVIKRSIAEWKLVMALFVSSAILDFIYYVIINLIQERKNIVKVLKGGFL